MRGGLRGLALAPATRSFATVAGPDLNLTTGGTFGRASAAFQFTQAPTDGSSAFLQSVASGTRRSADTRGDGLGASLLMECARQNLVSDPRTINGTNWSVGTGTLTGNVATSPDGASLADRYVCTAGQFGSYNTASFGNVGRFVATQWARAFTGSASVVLNTSDGATAVNSGTGVTATTTWQRLEAQNPGGGAQSYVITFDGRAPAAGPLSQALDFCGDLHQVEAGAYYPTSPIAATGQATRPADVLSYATGQFPAAFLTTGMEIHLAPDASSTEIWNAIEEWRIVQYGGADCVRLAKNSLSVSNELHLQLVRANTVIATIGTVTFSRGQALTIIAKPSAGTIQLSGATTGNTTASGTGGAWAGGGTGISKVIGGGADSGGGTADTLYIGGDAGGLLNVTGRYLDARGLGTIPCIQVAP